MRYDFVINSSNESSHAYLRVEFESGMFVRDYVLALERIERAYNRLEFLEAESERLMELTDRATGSREAALERLMYRERQLEEWLSQSPDAGRYPTELLELMALDLMRQYSDRSLAGAVTVREYVERRLFVVPDAYTPAPDRALILDESSLHSRGHNDLLGIGKIVEVIVGAVGKFKVDRAKARKLEADSKLTEAKARKTDAECEVIRAKALKAQAEAMTKTYTALQKLGLSPEEAREHIARELRAAGDQIRPSIESGIIHGMSSLPYSQKNHHNEGDQNGTG